MELIDIINLLLKNFSINILTYFVILKIIGYKHNDIKKTIIISGASFTNAIIYICLIQRVNQLFSILITYLLFSIIIYKIINERIFFSIVVTFISFSITTLIAMSSMLISSIFLGVINPNIKVNGIVGLLLVISFEIIGIMLFLRMKRIKNGFPFLKNRQKIDNIGVIGIGLLGIVILIYSIIGTYNNYKVNTYMIIGLIIELICMTVWLRRKITKFYKQKLKEQTVEDLTNEIKEKDELITKISEENKALATINHKYSSRIRALENFTRKIAVKPELVEKFNTEFGVDFTAINEQISNLSKEYSEEINKTIKINTELPKTGIFGIDNLLEFLSSEATKNNIKLNLKLDENISEIIGTVIPQNKLETLLGDHIKDAIIAINSSEGTNKEILLEIRKNEISIYDTGIEFEIDTLLKLGLEQVTTHKATGGSGIGFMTTFETLKETNASLEIEEMKDNKYTKAVKVIFDGLNEYRIKTYRTEEIIKQMTDDRIKIVE